MNFIFICSYYKNGLDAAKYFSIMKNENLIKMNK